MSNQPAQLGAVAKTAIGAGVVVGVVALVVLGILLTTPVDHRD